MAAEDAVSHRQFHGTDVDLQPGDKIRPGNEVQPREHGPTLHSSLVWSTNRARWASGFGKNVYQVKHEGMVNAPPDKYAPIPGSHVSLEATVVKKIKPSTIERLHYARQHKMDRIHSQGYLPR